MFELILNYFTLSRLKTQIKNGNISLLSFYDKATTLSNKASVQRFVLIRESHINSYSYIGYSSNIFRAAIGKFCSISRFVNIGLGTHPTSFLSTSPVFFSVDNGTGYSWVNKDMHDGKPKPVTIGNDVWVGMNVTIMGGVKIGNGAIIGAHSVVTKDIPPYAIVGGIPAKIIKFRFSTEIIDKLEKLSWWDLPEEVLKNNIDFFQKELNETNIDEFISRVNKLV